MLTTSLTSLLHNLFKGRITPAFAWSTLFPKFPYFSIRDHPRLRGEHFACKAYPPPITGSPLPSRGAPWWFQLPLQLHRITPCLRGEHYALKEITAGDQGSPPPSRGALRSIASMSSPLRITPAFAGSTGLDCKIQKLGLGSPPPSRGAL